MAEIRSESSRFPSRYAPGAWVTPAQYIIEYVCENSAKHSRRDLPARFWKDEAWSQFFVSQTRAVNRLLKKYSHQAILSTVKKKFIRTLLPKWVEKEIAREEKIIQASLAAKAVEDAKKEKTKTNKKSIINKAKTRTANFGTSSMDKLLALDGEIEDGEEKG